MVIIIERELGTYNEADLIKEIAYAKLQERKRIERMAYNIASKLPEKFKSNRKKYLVAIDASQSFYQELKKILEILK